jgi:AcrR family transcriptional regulator
MSPRADQRAADPLREAPLDAAARVIARRGYQGTKIQDIVQEAGLSSGAVYGRFRSKGLPGPDQEAWEKLVARVVASFGDRGQPVG